MSGEVKVHRVCVLLALLVFVVASNARAQNATAQPSAWLRDIRIEQRLNESVPLALVFRDEHGRRVRLGDYFNGKPVILVLAYYDCPMLCTLVLNGLTDSLTQLKWNVGDEFNVVTVSFDPRESPALAAAKKEIYVRHYGRAGAAEGWHFLTGDEANIKQLTDAVGFHYAFDPNLNQYAHASGIMILTPQGKLARYFYGIEYPARDVRLGLVEASAGKIGSPVDQLLLLCYHYDASTGKYTRVAFNLMRVCGAATLVGLAAFMFVMLRREERRRRGQGEAQKGEGEGAARPAEKIDSAAGCRLPLIAFLPPLFPEAASTEAGKIDTLFFVLLAVCSVVALIVVFAICLFVVRYRRRMEDELAQQTRSLTWLEISWSVIPLFIFLGLFVWGAKLYFSALSPPPDALEINVVGKQWMWKFQHPEGQREINELHVPVNRPVKLLLSSQDVIHSFYVPAFRLHRDVVPGYFNSAWFEATKPGTYHLFCSQYCGSKHSEMGGSVIVLDAADYQRWLDSGAQDSLASRGQSLFQKLACVSCHTGNAQARGPYLIGLYGSEVQLQNGEAVRADENYLRESILNPQAQIVAGYQSLMPNFQNQLNEDQLVALIAYIKSLRPEREHQAPPISSPAGPQPSPVGDALKVSGK